MTREVATTEAPTPHGKGGGTSAFGAAATLPGGLSAHGDGNGAASAADAMDETPYSWEEYVSETPMG